MQADVRFLLEGYETYRIPWNQLRFTAFNQQWTHRIKDADFRIPMTVGLQRFPLEPVAETAFGSARHRDQGASRHQHEERISISIIAIRCKKLQA